jgi:peptide/nickel transport system substrate-binding protein
MRTRMRMRASGVAVSVCLALTAVGCGGGSDGGSGGDGEPTATKPTETVTVGNNLGCTALDVAVSTGGPDYEVAYEPLIRLEQNGELAPGLATSWTVKPGNKTITFTLRENARFSDGEPVTAQAVKTWLDYRTTVVSPLDNLMGPIASTRVISKFVVEATLEAPNPNMAMGFSNAMGSNWGFVASPRAIAKVKADPKSKYLGRQTAGAGQYVLDRKQTVLNDHCTYVPNKYYYDQSKIKWAKVVIKNVTDANTMLAGLQTGQIDVGQGESSTAAAAEAAGLKVIHTPGRLQGIYFFDHTGKLAPPLADVRVRQALNYAIDREKIATALFGEDAQPTSHPNPNTDGDDPSFDTYYDYNPEKAKQLLADAGYPNGFSFKVEAPGAWIGSFKTTQLAQAVSKYLAEVGVKMEITATSSLAVWQEALASKTYAGGSVIWGTNPTWAWYGLAMAPGGPLADQHGWEDPVSKKLWLKGRSAPPEEAAEIWRQLIKRTIEQAFFLPVLSPGFYSYVSDRVSGVEAVLDGAFSPVDGWAPAQ